MDIKHKGLRELFERERSVRLPEHLVPRIRNILGMLEAARAPQGRGLRDQLSRFHGETPAECARAYATS